MRFNASACSDVGQVRPGNEDAFVLRPEVGVFAVADGMGGHAAGEVASGLAADAIKAYTPPLRDSAARIEATLAQTARNANQQILEQANGTRELAGMGTTLTAVTIRLDDATLVCAHVGDSRLYRLRRNQLTQLTRDHTWVQEQVEAGALTAAAARNHPMSSMLTRALGTPDVAVDSFTTPVEPGDVYLLCSDGLTGMITDDQIHSALSEIASPKAACQRLIEEANQAGGRDNITAVVIQIET